MGKPINIIYRGTYVEFSLSNKRNKTKESIRVLVDVVDFEKHIDDSVCWFLYRNSSSGYYVRKTDFKNKNRSVCLHWLIFGQEFKGTNSKYVIDHISGNSLDNRGHNLRRMGRLVNGFGKHKSKQCKPSLQA